ncbi:serine/threonine kinase [Aureococcus anophagefferens]|nr:serine/threonine kinase [Aureococcus anophagefferens]
MAPAKDADLEPENWVMPEVLKPDEKELMETITRPEHVRQREEGDQGQAHERARGGRRGRAERRRSRRTARKKKGGCCGGGADDVVARKKFAKPGDLPGASRGGGGDDGGGDDERVFGAEDDAVLKDPSGGASYKIKKVIGEGGFSRVLLVEALGGHAKAGLFAAKIIPKSHLKLAGDSFIKATMLERDLLAGIAHPFVLGLYHSFQEKDRLVMVVDFCQGGSVHYHVNIAVKATGRGLDEKRSKFYVAEIALGLSQLHLFGIVHRDLKLENVLVKRSGHIAICDFGTSKTLKRTATDGAPDRSSMGDDTPGRRDAGRQPFTRSIIGTPAYMAPPRCSSSSPTTTASTGGRWASPSSPCSGPSSPSTAAATTRRRRCSGASSRAGRATTRRGPDTRAALQYLLQKLPKTRVTSLDQLKQLDLYAGFDWAAVETERARPPFVPALKSKDDMACVPVKPLRALQALPRSPAK